MCHGHPRHHPCSHTSINWHYCPAALIDLHTGVETPCAHLSYAAAHPSNSDCPLQNCQYKAMGGNWVCCLCNQGPNTLGWCTNLIWRSTDGAYREEQCAHGCCESCARSVTSLSSTSEVTFSEPRKATASRKFRCHPNSLSSHRRGSGFSIFSDIPTVTEEDSGASSELPSTPPTSTSLYSGRSSTGGDSIASSQYAIDLNRATMWAGSPISSPRKHKSASPAGKGHEEEKHKVRAC